MSLMQQKDLPVLIAVNERGIYVIDQIECVSISSKVSIQYRTNTLFPSDPAAGPQVRRAVVGLRQAEQRQRSRVFAVHLPAVWGRRERDRRHQADADLHPPGRHGGRLNHALYRAGQAAERERRGRRSWGRSAGSAHRGGRRRGRRESVRRWVSAALEFYLYGGNLRYLICSGTEPNPEQRRRSAEQQAVPADVGHVRRRGPLHWPDGVAGDQLLTFNSRLRMDADECESKPKTTCLNLV